MRLLGSSFICVALVLSLKCSAYADSGFINIDDKLRVRYGEFTTNLVLKKNDTEPSVFTMEIMCHTQGYFSLGIHAVKYYRMRGGNTIFNQKQPCVAKYSFDNAPPQEEPWVCSSIIVPYMNIVNLSARPVAFADPDTENKTAPWIERLGNAKHLDLEIIIDGDFFYGDFDLTRLHLVKEIPESCCQF